MHWQLRLLRHTTETSIALIICETDNDYFYNYPNYCDAGIFRRGRGHTVLPDAHSLDLLQDFLAFSDRQLPDILTVLADRAIG